jgi:hypothetical protein
VITKIKQHGDIRQFKQNNNFRKSLRTIIKVFNSKIKESFNKLRDSKLIWLRCAKVKSLFRILKDLKLRNTKSSFGRLKRYLYDFKR